MKKSIFYLCALLLLGNYTYGQHALPKELSPAEKDTAFNTGSGIDIPELDENRTNDLALLGKIWGLMKYHHPDIAKGYYNWDFELFRILPDYLKSESRTQRDHILLDWIDRYGEVSACEDCLDTPDAAFLKPDHAWMEESDMSKALKRKLRYIRDNRHQGKQFYIAQVPGIRNPIFNNEASYDHMPYPDEGFRLLAAYRYWNMVHYFYPYKHLMNKDWKSALHTHIPAFLQAGNELEYESAALQMSVDLDDTHAGLWEGNNAVRERKGKYYPPVRLGFVENKLVVTEYYSPELKEKTGLTPGDVITKIDGKPVENMVESLKKYYPASNEAARLWQIATDILRSNDPEKQIDVLRDNREIRQKLTLYERDSIKFYRKTDTGKSYRMLAGNIGYVTLANIRENEIQVIKDTFKNTRGIIIDIRNYPPVTVVYSLVPYFVTDTVFFVKSTVANLRNPGEFTFSHPLPIRGEDNPYQGKLVVLVNENTISSAEYTCMAFRSTGHATFIGSTTAGADGNASVISLPGGLKTVISGIGFYYPDGRETQRVGIVPDIEVKPTIEGIRQGRDEVLLKAIEWMEKE